MLMNVGPSNGHVVNILAEDMSTTFDFDAIGSGNPPMLFDSTSAWMLNSPPPTETGSMQYFDTSFLDDTTTSGHNSGTASVDDFGQFLQMQGTPRQSYDSTTTRHNGQGCMTTALQLIGELHVQTEACVVNAIDSLFGVQRPDIVVRELEDVLNTNRRALRTMAKVLECPCSNEQQVLTAVYLVAQRVVWWYATALSSSSTSEDDDESSPSPRVSTNLVW
jgi:hypothetical protein